jgi:hypothetical protein
MLTMLTMIYLFENIRQMVLTYSLIEESYYRSLALLSGDL